MWKCSHKFKGGQHETHYRSGGRTMTIRIALTEEQRHLLQLSLEIARDRFEDDAKISLDCYAPQLANQFDKQAKEAGELLMWVANAENVIIEEARD
jgi:hypothetical protein